MVSWPVIDGASLHQLVLTLPNGRQVSIFRSPQQAVDGSFSFIFTGLQPNTEYSLTLIVTNVVGDEAIVDNLAFTTEAVTTTQQTFTKPQVTDRPPNSLRIVEAKPHTITVTWPLIEGGSFYQLVLTYPDGNQMEIFRTPAESSGGSFYIILNSLQPGFIYDLALSITDDGGNIILVSVMTIQTPNDEDNNPTTVPTEIASTEGGTTTSQPITEQPENSIMVARKTEDSIFVSWGLIDGGSEYQLVLTYPDGREVTLMRVPSQANNGMFYVFFSDLQQGSSYLIQLSVKDDTGSQIYFTHMTVTTLGIPQEPASTTGGASEGVSSRRKRASTMTDTSGKPSDASGSYVILEYCV